MIVPDESLDTELQSRLTELRQRRLANFEKTSLAWLALTPGWTEQLAVACEFPTGGAGLREFLARLEQARLCSTEPATADEGLSFWVDESVRETVLDELRREHGVRFLQKMTAEIGKRLLAQLKSVPVPPAVMRWAMLAGRSGGDLAGAAAWLDHEIRTLVDSGQTSEALAWVDTSTKLAEVLGDVLDSAVLTGRRRLELAYRQAQDERHLADFLERKEQVQAFRELVEGQAGMWALHFIGMGGVGKTMLLRHITARVAPAVSAPTTRVDFDHLNPDYPVRRPGQLLSELAEELRSYATGSGIEKKFEDFQDRILELHEVLSGQPSPPDPMANIRNPLFDKALRVFSDLLSLLPAPVVLILDTCEELAKAPLVGALMPSVEATFEILERIHEQVPSTRVVFAGRRLLAQSGHEWSASDTLLPQGRGYLPKRKEYLGLHEIRGFDREEAQLYLERTAGVKPPSPMFDAVLKQSIETGTSVGVDLEGSKRSEQCERYNPFDLALFGDWIRRDRTVTSEAIATGETDPYVDMRIVQRLRRQPGVLSALPAVVLMRCFDETMLRPVLEGRSSAEVFRELGEQEWVDYRVDDSTKSGFLEIERNLYHRFLKYYHHPTRRGLLEEASRKLGPGLVELASNVALRDLNVAHLDAALRLAPLEAGAHLWEDVARRIPDEADWNWALGTAGRVLDATGAVNSPGHPLYAAIRATQIAGLTHQFPELDVLEAWTEVLKTAHQHPLPLVRKWLQLRAELQLARREPGRLESIGKDIEHFYETEIKGLDTPLGAYYFEQIAASAAGALESIIEQEEVELPFRGPKRQVPQLWPEHLSDVDNLSADIRAFASVLSARRLLLASRWQDAGEQVARALNLVKARDQLPVQRWADWPAPQYLCDRIRLEALRLEDKLGGAFEQQLLIEWQREAASHLESIDSERLASRILQRRLAAGPVCADELESLWTSDRYDADRQPIRVAQRSTPPLFAFIALGLVATGKADRALKIIEERLTDATISARDEVTVRACELTEAMIIRRLRMRDRATRFVLRVRGSNNPDALAMARPVASLCGLPDSDATLLPRPDRNTSPQALHEWWQCQDALGIQKASEITALFKEFGPDATEKAKELDDRTLQLSLELDSQEQALISARLDGQQAGRRDLSGSAAAAMIPGRGTGNQAREDVFRSMLRASVLGQSQLSYPEWIRSLPDGGSYFQQQLQKLGRRRAAEIAQEEGELLGLRVPSRAVILLDRAREWFEESEDNVGTFTSSIAGLTAAIQAQEIGAEAARQWIAGKVRPPFEALAKAGARLPEWKELGSAADLSPLDDPVWGGWIERLVHCMARTDPGLTELAAALQTRFASRYGTAIPAELRLVELPEKRGAHGSRERVRTVLHGAVRVATLVVDVALLIIWAWFFLKSSHETLGQLAKSAGVLLGGGMVAAVLMDLKQRVAKVTRLPLYNSHMWTVIGGLTGLGMLVLGYWFVGWLVRFIEPGGVRWFWQILLCGAIVLAISAVVATVKQVSRAIVKTVEAVRAALSEVTLTIWMPPESVPPRVDPSVSLPVVLQRLARAAVLRFSPFPTLREEELEPLETAGSTPDLRDYRSAAEEIPAALRKDLQKRASQLWMFSLPVPLDIEPPLAGFPWEALLAEAIDRLDEEGDSPPGIPAAAKPDLSTRKRSSERLRFWRSGPPLARSTSVEATWKDRGVTVISSRTWALMAEKGWKGFTDRVAVSEYLRSGSSNTSSILHVIGTPVRTSAGLQIQLGDPGTKSGRESAERMSKGMLQSRAKPLIGIETLPVDRAWLVILQAEPVSIVRRLESEREQSFDLRASAADIFAAGAGAVLMLPALSPDLAEKALTLIASKMPRSRPPRLKELLKTVAELRRLIARSAKPAEEHNPQAGNEQDLRELSLDVTLFARDGRKSAEAAAPPQEGIHHV